MQPYWTPPRLFAGQAVFVLGGGPSLTQVDVDKLRGRAELGRIGVIAVNCAAKLAAWAQVLFFNDTSWFAGSPTQSSHRALVASWAGLVVTGSRVAAREMPDKCKRVRFDSGPGFPPVGAGGVKQGRSSGQKATGLAVAMAGARIVLMGFDMREVAGPDGRPRSHFHDEYRCRDPEIYARSFAPAFKGWHAQARSIGVEIVNATPGSALTEFPMTTLDDELARLPIDGEPGAAAA